MKIMKLTIVNLGEIGYINIDDEIKFHCRTNFYQNKRVIFKYTVLGIRRQKTINFDLPKKLKR